MAEILNPQDAELEEVILGACLIGREAMPMVADRLRPEMFYFDKKKWSLNIVNKRIITTHLQKRNLNNLIL